MVSDQKQYRNIIIWLEDQKIRHYKIEDRVGLRNVDNADWIKHFEAVSYFIPFILIPYVYVRYQQLLSPLLDRVLILEHMHLMY